MALGEEILELLGNYEKNLPKLHEVKLNNEKYGN
jgi:hypothetical protein